MAFAPPPTRLRALVLAACVAVVLADSSVVILALPDILDQYDVSVASVAWVLTAFNLALAVAAVPMAYLARRGARTVFVAGLVAFAAASWACAVAGAFDHLLIARCVQAVGGAGVVCAALELLSAVLGSTQAAARQWAGAAALGTVVGPAVGGALTQLINWQAIFVAQVPVVLAVAAVIGITVPVHTHPAGRPRLRASLALLLISAALTAALFLLVLMMINGWGMSPLAAAATASVMPVAAIVSGRVALHHGSLRTRAIAGAVLIAGGLAALGLMPGAEVMWTLVPQVLLGVGLGLAVAALTEVALDGVAHLGVHGGWSVAARHLGVVVGIVLLTPVFVADLEHQQSQVERSVTAVVLDAPIDPADKITLAQRGVDVIAKAGNAVPDLAPIFEGLTRNDADAAALTGLRNRLDAQLRLAGTAAVTRSFLFAAGFAVLAILPLLAMGRRTTT